MVAFIACASDLLRWQSYAVFIFFKTAALHQTNDHWIRRSK